MTNARADTAPVAGIAFMFAGVFCLTVSDAIAKWLGAFYPIVQVAFMRMLLTLPLVVTAGLLSAGRQSLVTRQPVAHVGRGLLATCATLTFYLALTLLPLAEATAIGFSAPLFVTLLAAPLVGERPGLAQWGATCVGFLGVLLIVQPGRAAFALAALVPLGTALSYALLMLTARMLGRRDSIWVTMLYATAIPLLITGVMLPWHWQKPALAHLPHFIGLGFFGGSALTLITQAFRVGIASLVAPFEYTGLIWAVLFGWILWGEIPGRLSILGGIVIAMSGIYLAYRQARAGQRRRTILDTHK